MTELKELNLEAFGGDDAVTCDVEAGVCAPVTAADNNAGTAKASPGAANESVDSAGNAELH